MPSTASRRPVAVAAAGCSSSSSSSSSIGGGTTAATTAAAAAAAARRRNEIFVDVIERVSAVLTPAGQLMRAAVDGTIQMKSYLDPPPLLKLALTDQISINDLSLFESEGLLLFKPPAGEFSLLNYSLPYLLSVPFRLFPAVEELAHGKAEVTLRLRADLPEQCSAANLCVSVSIPKSTTSASLEVSPPILSQGGEFIPSEHRVQWLMKKMQGGSEVVFRARLAFNPSLPLPTRAEFGPATLGFEVPMYNVSSLQG
ncbi:uncharacterized protein EMH_0039590 [Eimeria mitis]|uniref:MHD domain-containing protein n=1 Tax=Eimeria mitis TaxID=44415 RepID=U6JW67_9EIME|nr:uncharacterized protein EMH_0039590 [Eimeria mitis]CDJ28297.1 hypothetical protein, conserved [Eimeria mitis]